MKVWQCDVFADEEFTLPCVHFVGRFTSAHCALNALQRELAEVQVVLHPGPMKEIDDDGSCTDTTPFRMLRGFVAQTS